MTSFGQGTAFTYQGMLNNNGSPANGSFDVQFTLFATNLDGAALAGPVTNLAVPVSNGLFTACVDFGNAFVGMSTWLEIAVSTNAANAFNTLAPRQQLLPVPYAIFANTASNLLGNLPAAQLSGMIPTTNLSGTLQATQLPPEVLTNNQTGITLSGTLKGDGAGLTNGDFWADGTNLVIVAGYLRPTIQYSNSLVAWAFSPDPLHAGFNGGFVVSNVAGGSLTFVYRTNFSRIVSLVVCPDEQLQSFGVTVGASVNTSNAIIYASIPLNMSGLAYWDTNTSNYIFAGPAFGSVSYTPGSGLLHCYYHTAYGPSQGYSVLQKTDVSAWSVTPNLQAARNGISYATDPFANDQSGLNVYAFSNGIALTGTSVLPQHCGFTVHGPCQYSMLNLCSVNTNGSNSWETNVLNPLSNFWIYGVFER